MIKRGGIVILFFALLMLGCDKDDTTENESVEIGPVPEIELLRIAPDSVQQFGKPVEFTIKYSDGDGNLGFEDADSTSIEITDLRADLVHRYHMPPVAPIDSVITITGSIIIQLENIILIDETNTSESATFSIRMKDRAGNWSNTINSSPIMVTQ